MMDKGIFIRFPCGHTNLIPSPFIVPEPTGALIIELRRKYTCKTCYNHYTEDAIMFDIDFPFFRGPIREVKHI